MMKQIFLKIFLFGRHQQQHPRKYFIQSVLSTKVLLLISTHVMLIVFSPCFYRSHQPKPVQVFPIDANWSYLTCGSTHIRRQ
jgi:hypothetical protein